MTRTKTGQEASDHLKALGLPELPPELLGCVRVSTSCYDTQTHRQRAEEEDFDQNGACQYCLDEAVERAEEAEAERDAALDLLAGATCSGGDELHPLGLDGAKASAEAGDKQFLCAPCRDWQAGRI